MARQRSQQSGPGWPGRGDRWEKIRDCRFGIRVPDLAPLRTPPDELRKTLHPSLVAVKMQYLAFRQQNPRGRRLRYLCPSRNSKPCGGQNGRLWGRESCFLEWSKLRVLGP